MGYWSGKYTEHIGDKDFIDGIIAGAEAYAVWQSGEQLVGILKKPLKDVIAEIKKELKYPD